MFERYTEAARRVIFFARYEASQYGSAVIDTEHLLLGLVREDRDLLDHFIPRKKGLLLMFTLDAIADASGLIFRQDDNGERGLPLGRIHRGEICRPNA